MNMICTRYPTSHFPPQSPLHLNIDKKQASILLLRERLSQVSRDRDVRTVQKRGPNDGILMALVAGREAGGDGDSEVLVVGVDVETVVVDADAVVFVVGGEGDLQGGVEGGVGVELELGDGDVAKVESGLGGTEDEEDDQDDEEGDDEESEEEGE